MIGRLVDKLEELVREDILDKASGGQDEQDSGLTPLQKLERETEALRTELERKNSVLQSSERELANLTALIEIEKARYEAKRAEMRLQLELEQRVLKASVEALAAEESSADELDSSEVQPCNNLAQRNRGACLCIVARQQGDGSDGYPLLADDATSATGRKVGAADDLLLVGPRTKHQPLPMPCR